MQNDHRALLFGALFFTGCALTADADAQAPTCQTMAVTQVVAQNSAGNVVFCIHTPEAVPTATTSWQLSASLSSPQLTGAAPSLTLTLTIEGGCTSAPPQATGTAANAPAGTEQARTWSVTMSSTTCRGYVEGKAVSGGAVLFDAYLAFNVNAQDLPQELSGTLGASTSFDAWFPIVGAWLGWLAYTIATRFLRPQPMRILADIIGYAVLALPLDPEQFIALTVAQSSVVIFDLVQLITGKEAAN